MSDLLFVGLSFFLFGIKLIRGIADGVDAAEYRFDLMTEVPIAALKLMKATYGPVLGFEC